MKVDELFKVDDDPDLVFPGHESLELLMMLGSSPTEIAARWRMAKGDVNRLLDDLIANNRTWNMLSSIYPRKRLRSMLRGYLTAIGARKR